MKERCKVTSSNGEVACENCGLYGILGVVGKLEPSAPDDLDRILRKNQSVTKGENLFRAGQPFHALYAVKKGSFKSYTFLEGGQEQVVGFQFPGELLGLEAVSSPHYAYSARALEDGSVCELRFEDLGLMKEHLHPFQEQLIRILSGQLLREQRQNVLSARQSAEERLAAFLIGLSRRLAERQLAETKFRLAMSRQDIASYLGLAVETVSRTFKLFQARGLLSVKSKRIRLIDRPGLGEVAQLSSE
ncbi:MAG: helix-turn-helix domain-containing protein [Gammaproteobacteria bacterium]|nr:helix-turn-helix domain-containing protein [Gammaproteobacteria bacterium]